MQTDSKHRFVWTLTLEVRMMQSSPDRPKNDAEQLDLTDDDETLDQTRHDPTDPINPTQRSAGYPASPLAQDWTQHQRSHDPSRLRRPTTFHRNWIVAVLAIGVLADITLRNPPWNNIGGTVLVAATGIGLLLSGWMQTRTSRLLTVGAMTFGLFLSLRTDPLLIALNLFASAALLFLAAAYGRRTRDVHGHDFWDFGPTALLNDSLEPIVRVFAGIEELVDEIRVRAASRNRDTKNRDQIRSVAVGAAITVPLLLILGSLLASADPIFASFFTFDLPNPGNFFVHPFLLAIGAIVMALLLRIASRKLPHPETHVPTFGWVEASVILGGLVSLFALFTFSQFLAFSETGDEALAEIGLRYKQYARQGFFQLLVVATLTLGTITTLHSVTRTQYKGATTLRYLSAIAVGQTLFIVLVAYERLQRYVTDDGLTPLRFYSLVFSLLVGAAFIATGVRVMGLAPTKKWLTPVLVVLGFATLAGLNLANPERIIAQHNIDRDEVSILFHMEKQTGDGDATTATNLDQLSEPLRSDVKDRLCLRWTEPEGSGILDWNYGQSQSDNELERLCDR